MFDESIMEEEGISLTVFSSAFFRGAVAGIILGCMLGIFLIVAAIVGCRWYLNKRKEQSS